MISDREEATDEVCANCSKTPIDDIKLKICTACKLVKYCSVDCQKNHRPQHRKACKKRAAEIREDNLFIQPEESHLGECPICVLPLPIDLTKSMINTCCCKFICLGCSYANTLREMELRMGEKCPYCRAPPPKTDEEGNKNVMERGTANDPVALCEIGKKCYEEGDHTGAFETHSKAAALGDAAGHYELSRMYDKGIGVERNPKKRAYHLEEAAIGGHPYARNNLGCIEGNNERFDRSIKHFIIAAKLGYDDALKKVKGGFVMGLVRKEDFEAALRGYQAAVDATKSEQREEAYKRVDTFMSSG